MPNTLIKNKGGTQTLIHHHNKKHHHEINLNADYDGNTANISVKTDTNGNKQQYKFTLDEDDLDDLLSIPSVQEPLHKRLVNDFMKQPKSKQRGLNNYYIELPGVEIKNNKEFDPIQTEPTTIEDLLQTYQPHRHRHLSTPTTDEEFIVPITINNKHHAHSKYILTPKKHHRRKKTHNTYKIYKKHKSNTKSATKSRSKSTTNSKSKKHNNSHLFHDL